MTYLNHKIIAAVSILILITPLVLSDLSFADVVIGENPIPSSMVKMEGITTGSDGALWFSESNNNSIGRITTAGSVSEYVLPGDPVDPGSITSGPDGALWFADLTQGTGVSQIGRITTAAVVTEYAVPSDNDAVAITAGPDGALWFSEVFNNVGRVSLVGDTTPPRITYSVNPVANSYGWNNTSVNVSFTCTDDVAVATCTAPITIGSEGAGQTATGTAIDEAGNSTAVTTSPINIDTTPPLITGAGMSNTIILLTSPETITANVSDTLAGVAKGEYYIDTDPGQGNGSSMTYASGTITASTTLGSGLSVGQHTLYVRTEDKAGNWSTSTSKQFVYL